MRAVSQRGLLSVGSGGAVTGVPSGRDSGEGSVGTRGSSAHGSMDAL